MAGMRPGTKKARTHAVVLEQLRVHERERAQQTALAEFLATWEGDR
jgi:hypothetical protein